jgi:FKBP-type peptidyl-prolyl cis-trans isomerase
MRKIFHLLFFISCFLQKMTLVGDEIVLSKEEEKTLREFFHALLWGSEVGYVLYGDKPICVESYSGDLSLQRFTVRHHLQTSIREGVKIWNKLQLPFHSSKFSFIVQPCKSDSVVLFINKPALKNVFDDNANLFRHALGFKLTSDELLEEFNKKDFFSTLKDDDVLIGILLGFGVDNCLWISRAEAIRGELDPPTIKLPKLSPNYPFFERKRQYSLFKDDALKPSIGYSSLQEELEDLNRQIEFASPCLEKYSPRLIFGIVSDSPQNEKLIKNYEKSQLKILDVLDKPNWLEEALSTFYDRPIQIKVVDTPSHPSDVYKNVNLPQFIAKLLINSLREEFEIKKLEDLQSCLEGRREADKRIDAHHLAPFPFNLERQYGSKGEPFMRGFKIWSFYKFNEGLFPLESVISEVNQILNTEQDVKIPNSTEIFSHLENQLFENLESFEKALAISQFNEMLKSDQISLKTFIKDRLYYQQIKQGNGKYIGDDPSVKISYTLKTAYGHVIEREKDFLLDIQRAIKGFHDSLPAMRAGEKGILYIHPDLGIKEYSSPPYYSPYLIAEFEISDR